MKLLDLTCPTPAENLACDEALLDSAENGAADEVLRFWEVREHFVVVGYSNKVATEVNVKACEARAIPILRRCSGGGTVLQGPGCLNYTLILRISEDGPVRNISTANRFIMERNREAIQSAIDVVGHDTPCAPRQDGFATDGGQRSARPTSRAVGIQGHTDLAIDGKKFSGNSQRRRKHYLLFHGTFLLNFNLQLISELLRMPSKQPGYREDRAHGDFLVNLDVSSAAVKAVLIDAWNARGTVDDLPTERISKLVTEKYVNRDWNFKF